MAVRTKNEDLLHRLTDIRVNEVSLVDRPANLQPFLVVKRDSSMGAEIKTNADGELVTKDDEPAAVVVPDDETKIGKAGAKMSKDNLARLTQAIDTLLSLQGALVPAAKSAPNADGGGDDKEDELSEKMDEMISKLDAQGTRLDDQSATISSLNATVVSQQATIKTLKKSKSSRTVGMPARSQAIEVEVTKAVAPKPVDESWPDDMNQPQPKYQF